MRADCLSSAKNRARSKRSPYTSSATKIFSPTLKIYQDRHYFDAFHWRKVCKTLDCPSWSKLFTTDKTN
jgi:hypothetical protein